MSDRVRIEIAVLDLAGTTVSDSGVVEAAVCAVAGDRFDPMVFRRYRGASKRDLLAALVGHQQLDRAFAEFERQLCRAVRAGKVLPLPGAEQCLRDLHARGIRVCLITGFSSVVREELIDCLGWRGLVELALSPQDAGRGRPAPDLVLTAALRLGASDVRAVAVAGDTINDLLAAYRAGSSIRAGVLTGAHSEAELRSAPHTHILDRVGDLAGLLD